jgi:hypothetical protein
VSVQRSCLTYSASPDQIIYDESARRLSLAQQAGYEVGRWNDRTFFVPLAWQFTAPFAQSNGTAFLHELREADGKPVIVAVDVSPYEAPFEEERRIPLAFTVMDFTGVWSLAKVKNGRGVNGYIRVKSSDKVAIYAGQVDKNDRTRFTIRYKVNDQEGRIFGRLLPTGWVQLSPDPDSPTTLQDVFIDPLE